ncbi:hypothetical protein conserved [Leishmania donovani]|uniref:Hypothetical_protein_conserved n=1 Tax=Leishmania donovani TaxID=5661 RepID=A0A6J8FTL3_LEIDO|nr:hypothetical protein conserved [Leishmania donovani]VDZ49239.1 hypothetical_protein_conserved [Leishmania donovani]
MENIKEEICLVANIIDRLLAANGSLRADELEPLTKRLRVAAGELSRIDQESQSGPVLSPFSRNIDGAEGIGGGGRRGPSKLQLSKSLTPLTATRKQIRGCRSFSATCKKMGDPKVFVSSEISQSVCCSLYNLLEGTTRLLRGSHGHIFVKRGVDMFSIANVSRKLAFPPPQVHHRCLGSADAEVLGSSIALNRNVDEVGRKSAVLIFPVHKLLPEGGPGEPIATIHVERREHVFFPFSESDEYTLYFASLFCGELMSRIPQINFLETFYDPSTQLIIAPFEPHCPVVLPPIERGMVPMRGETGKQASENPEYAARAVSQLSRKISARAPEILIHRESRPTHNTKPFAPGVTHMPSLLEIKAYVENLQSCWKKNMLDNVDLLELDRGTQQDLKVARSELAATRRELAATADRLRLYELDAWDYKLEYGAMKSELDAYMDSLERLH